MLKGSFGKKSDHFFDDVFSTIVCGNSRGRKFPLLKLLSPICHRAHHNYSQRQWGRCEVSPAPTRRFPVTSNPPWRERTDQSWSCGSRMSPRLLFICDWIVWDINDVKVSDVIPVLMLSRRLCLPGNGEMRLSLSLCGVNLMDPSY